MPRLSFLNPFLICAISICALRAAAQRPPNANPAYQQLRNLLPGAPAIYVENTVLKRDVAVFTFVQGDFAFYGEVNGKITGAVFIGKGHLSLTPPTPTERHSLQVLTKKPVFEEDFHQVVLRFTDDTAAELKKDAHGPSTGPHDSSATHAATDFRTFQRQHLFENIDLRLLEDVLSPTPGSFFLAAIKGQTNPNILLEIDPRGAPIVAPEEVRLGIWNQWGWSWPAAFHLDEQYANNTASSREENAAFTVDHEDLDTSIERSGFLAGLASVHLHALIDGVTVVPLKLFPTLRVSRVDGEHGEVLDYVQEKKEEDSGFALILEHPLKKGEAAIVHVTYGGKDAVRDAGNNNYDPIARESWFPNGGTGFGGYTTYRMLFHSPKEDELIATGNKLSDRVDGKIRTTEWDTKVALPVVGFHMGDFAMKEDKTPQGLDVKAYANKDLPDWARNNNYGTTSMLPVELSEGKVAAQIYETYFGKLPFDHLALSQQPACNYGQSWPMLVYLPICGFWDSTIQHMMGLPDSDPYWKVVTAHEVAHQWWGHTVGFKSYRDQWMSEGFANASAAIFLEMTRKSKADSRDYWKQLKEDLVEKNADGFRPIDVGPVTMGLRLSSPKTGWSVYSKLVYPKGAYILHMIQMMMWSPKTGDEKFIAMMHDFTQTYQLRVATTEDFKAIVDKHMTQDMDLDRNHRMDWFFNEYVYGTELPRYHLESQITPDGDKIKLHVKLIQSGVSDSFKMSVPLYFEANDGRMFLIARVNVIGNSTIDQTVSIGKPPMEIKRISIDSMHDLLAIDN